MHVRYDEATRRVKDVSVPPFTKPLAEGEAQVEIADTMPPAAADGERNWMWCRVTGDTVAVDPALIPAKAPDRRAALRVALDDAIADPTKTTAALAAIKDYLAA